MGRSSEGYGKLEQISYTNRVERQKLYDEVGAKLGQIRHLNDTPEPEAGSYSARGGSISTQIVSSVTPAGSLIRARGYISTAGYFGSANGLVESTLDQRLRIVLDDSHFGVSSNHFGFTIAGYSGEVVVIEASTNLLNWTALATNSLQSDTLFFSDPETITGPRFYRVHSP